MPAQARSIDTVTTVADDFCHGHALDTGKISLQTEQQHQDIPRNHRRIGRRQGQTFCRAIDQRRRQRMIDANVAQGGVTDTKLATGLNFQLGDALFTRAPAGNR